MKQIFVLILLSILVSRYSLGASNISVKDSCSFGDFPVNLKKDRIFSDLKINISEKVSNPDYVFKIVTKKNLADFIILDRQLVYDYSICKSTYSLNEPILKNLFDSDIDIKIIRFTSNYDYSIFIDSATISLEEALEAVVFHVL